MSGPTAIELIRFQLPLLSPFRTSFATMIDKEAILVRAVGPDGAEGWGECVAAHEPGYSYEWNDGAFAILRDRLAPATLAGADAGVRGHPMAKAALEVALLDLELRRRAEPLARHLGGDRDRIECGVSVGIQGSTEDLIAQVDGHVSAGYRRVKLKIEPGLDVEPVRAVREAFPDLPLSVDANAAYEPDDVDALLPLDELGLVYIEQPLAEEHLLAHADLQSRLDTPICLDETITSAIRAEEAIRLGACRVINVKLGRVGGLAESLRIHEVARASGVPLWCGGMLESGIGRAANVALASLPGFTLPGDTSPSSRYFERDLTEPFTMDPDGTMEVPRSPGIGRTPDPDRLEQAAVERHLVRR